MLIEQISSNFHPVIALEDKTHRLSYGALPGEVERRAQELAEVRVLGIALDNSVEWVLWDLAALKANVVCVPLPPFFTPQQREHAIQSAGISHILLPNGLRATGTPPVPHIPEGTVKISYTSGSTGEPKGVCLSQQAMIQVAESIVARLGGGLVHHVCTLPLAVLLENVAGVYAALMAGGTVHLPSLADFGTNYAQLRRVLHDTKVDSVILVPETLRLLMQQVASEGALPDMRFAAVGGAKVDASIVLAARHMGLPVYEGYGLSECASVVALNTPEQDKPGTVGTLLPHMRLEIRNGEIYIYNPGFLGYIDETAPEILPSGDLGGMDTDGFLTISGRKKNMLITSYGRNVSPEWVESVLIAQPEIAQTVVYGDGAPHLSALIVPTHPHADITQAVARVNAQLPNYAQVMQFRITPPFTVERGLLTGNGRVKRQAILRQYTDATTEGQTHDILSTTD